MGKLKINPDFSLGRLDLVTKGFVSTKFLGGYQSVFKGVGLEFSDYRRYVQGMDDSSKIDWKASRRVNDLLVKEYVEERNLEIMFLVDVSQKMLTGSTKKLKAEYIAELVSSFAYTMLVAGDAVGMTLFSDKIVKTIPPQSGMKQFYSITKSLTETKNYGGYSDVDKAIDHIFKRGGENMMVILISDFVFPLKSDRTLKLASRKFDLISMMVRDPRDMTLPEGMGEIVLQDPYSEEVLLVNANKIGKEYAREATSEVTKVKNLMKQSGASFLFLETGKPFVKYLVEFFKRKEAKWR